MDFVLKMREINSEERHAGMYYSFLCHHTMVIKDLKGRDYYSPHW
jgi:hypothetical protein